MDHTIFPAYSTVTECSALMMVQLETSGSFEHCKLTLDRKKHQLEFEIYSSKKKSAEIETQPSIIINTDSITHVSKVYKHMSKKIRAAHPHCFQILCCNRSYRFSLRTELALDTWIKDIKMASSNCHLKPSLRRKNSTEKKNLLTPNTADAGGGPPRLESMIGGYTVEVIAGVVRRIPLDSKESKTPVAKRKQNIKDNKSPAIEVAKIFPENGKPKMITRAASDDDLYGASSGHRRSLSYGSTMTSTTSIDPNKNDHNSNRTFIPHFSPNLVGEVDKVNLRPKVVRSNSDGSRYTRTQVGIKIIRSGYCVKQSRSLTKGWKRFFMEFDPTEICFYNNDYKKKLLKKIKCNNEIIDVKKSDSTKIKDRDNLMEIVMKTKKIFIQFDTPEELSGWIDAMRRHFGFSCRTYL